MSDAGKLTFDPIPVTAPGPAAAKPPAPEKPKVAGTTTADARPPLAPSDTPPAAKSQWVAEVLKLLKPSRGTGVAAAGILSLLGGAGAASYLWPKTRPPVAQPETARAAPPGESSPLPDPPAPAERLSAAPPTPFPLWQVLVAGVGSVPASLELLPPNEVALLPRENTRLPTVVVDVTPPRLTNPPTPVIDPNLLLVADPPKIPDISTLLPPTPGTTPAAPPAAVPLTLPINLPTTPAAADPPKPVVDLPKPIDLPPINLEPPKIELAKPAVPPPPADLRPPLGEIPLPTADLRPPLAKAPPPPAVRPASLDVQTDYDVDLHEAKAGDTFEGISRKYLGDDRYAAAIRAYNGGATAMPRSVQVPPIHVLRKQYANVIGRPAERADWQAAPASRPAAGNTTYIVPAGGATLRDVAQKALGDENQWKALWELNPKLLPDVTQREGTVVVLPAK